jgi:ankyrin repeat protein
MKTRLVLPGVTLLTTALWAAPDAALIDAVKKSDQAAISALLSNHADPNIRAADGATALHWAARMDALDTAQRLIRAGANVNAMNRFGVTPLSLAAVNGSARMITLLLTSGADVNKALPEGETPLMTAARTGNVDAVNALIVHGAQVNAVESWKGQTALMWAAAEGHAAVVESLLGHGADFRLRAKGGFTAFLFAVREGKPEVVKMLLKAGGDANEMMQGGARVRGTSALVLAVSNAHYELASLLLQAGANPNGNEQGWTALHEITWVRKPGQASNDPAPSGSGNLDSLDLVRSLVAHGANVNARMTKRVSVGLSSLNTMGATPFLLAARTGDAELMRLLVQLGADPKLANTDNTTPLMVAAGVGTRSPGEDAGSETECLEAVKVAVEFGNDLNAVDANGETAMHGAAYKWLPSVAQYLLNQGADLNAWNHKNKSGWTPLRIAEGVHRGMNLRASPEVAAVLRKAMIAAGVSTAVDPESVVSGATK